MIMFAFEIEILIKIPLRINTKKIQTSHYGQQNIINHSRSTQQHFSVFLDHISQSSFAVEIQLLKALEEASSWTLGKDYSVKLLLGEEWTKTHEK